MNRKILLLHGALGTKEQLNSLKEKLSSEFEVHTLDFEGHGNHSSTKEFSMQLFTKNVVDYLRENQIDNIHLFGYSMGGYVGLNLAKEHPELVDKIITLGTKFNWTKETAEKEIKMLNPEKIVEKVPAFASKLNSIHSNNNWKEVVIKTANMMRELGNGKKLTQKELEVIPHEILIGVGSNDQLVSIEESKKSANTLLNGQLVIIEGFYHPIEQINEEKLHSIITKFIIK